MSAKRDSLVRRLRRSLHDLGPLYTAHNVVGTIFPKRVLRASTAFIVAADLPGRTDPFGDPDVRWATETDAALLAQSDGTAAEFLEQFAAGAQIVVLECDKVLQGYFIYRTSSIDQYSWLRYRMPSNVVWHAMAWTAPAFRGQRVHTRIQDFAFAALARQGYVRMVASVDAVNIASLRSSMRECSLVGSVSYLRSFDLTAVWLNGRLRLGHWHQQRPLEVDTEMFRVIPNRPYGPVDPDHFERLVGKRT
jgi:hypothetical protein